LEAYFIGQFKWEREEEKKKKEAAEQAAKDAAENDAWRLHAYFLLNDLKW